MPNMSPLSQYLVLPACPKGTRISFSVSPLPQRWPPHNFAGLRFYQFWQVEASSSLFTFDYVRICDTSENISEIFANVPPFFWTNGLESLPAFQKLPINTKYVTFLFVLLACSGFCR